ncbi:MAG: UDP-N-acetylglucosamine 1-carboxyvinyltransferase [Promethearchaeota archaeon]
MIKNNDFFDSIKENSYIFAKKGQPLFGTVQVSGAKNMVTKIMTASLIAKNGKIKIKNIPLIDEIFVTLRLFDQLGIKYKIDSDKSLEIERSAFNSSKIKFTGKEGNRISLFFATPILSQFGEATIAKPKGCNIGKRKINFHIQALEKFGVRIEESADAFHMKLGNKGLRGIHFRLPFPSVGATENLLMTAVVAKGETVIDNCAIEPEIIELVKFLQKAGIEIVIHGDRSIYINGGKDFKLSEITIIPDRVETMSLAAAALSTKGDVFIKGARHDLMITPLGILEKMGVGVEVKDDGIRFFYKEPLKPISINTDVYPGFPTDFQQPLAILLSQIKGRSYIHETIFEDRFEYLRILNPLIKNNRKFIIKKECPKNNKCRFNKKGHFHLAKIEGPVQFGTGKVTIPDLRAGFALLNAACLSEGIKIYNPKLLFRGYENPVGKLKALGANIELVL